MEADMDSIELLEFRTLLARQFAVTLEPPFLFQYNTKGKIIEYFAEQQQEDPGQSGTKSVLSSAQQPIESYTGSVTQPSSAAQRPMAIIGMALHFPGECHNPQQFWQLLQQGESAIGELTTPRWQWPHQVDLAQQSGIEQGGFITGIDQFDPQFFRLSPVEAELMDPQQRWLMQLSWQALEHSGYQPSRLAGSDTGVFIGACHFDYRELLQQSSPPDALLTTSSHGTMLANRLSYFYDFKGPSVVVDTACSSALVAVHQAVTALRQAECGVAMVAAVNLICASTNSLAFQQAGMLSADGLCYTFDQRANGFVRGEGAAVLMLKPFSQAQQDADIIHGVILGSAVNHGGQSSSLTAPSPQAQAQLLQQACRDAQVSPLSIGYIEAHGTGTAFGDPIEVAGLHQAFANMLAEQTEPAELASTLASQFSSQSASQSAWCGLGSVKTNIGHLEGAAGIADMIKTLLCFTHQQLPPSLNYQTLNPHIHLAENSPFFVVDQLQDWPTKLQPSAPYRAGVSSFGFGGTNAHVIMEQYLANDVQNDTQNDAQIAQPQALPMAQQADPSLA